MYTHFVVGQMFGAGWGRAEGRINLERDESLRGLGNTIQYPNCIVVCDQFHSHSIYDTH